MMDVISEYVLILLKLWQEPVGGQLPVSALAQFPLPEPKAQLD